MASLTLLPGFTAEASLELSTDGPIPSHLRAAARAIDAAAAAKARPAAVRIGRITMKRHIAVDLMAGIIAGKAGEACVTREDFARAGFSGEQIDDFALEAFAEAKRGNPHLADWPECRP